MVLLAQIIIAICCIAIVAVADDESIFHGKRVLQVPDRAILHWKADLNRNLVTYTFKAKSISWIGLGLSKTGQSNDYQWHFGYPQRLHHRREEFVHEIKSVVKHTHYEYRMIKVTEMGGYKHMTFTKTLIDETERTVVNIVPRYISYAYGGMANKQFLGRYRRDEVVVDLVPVEVQGPETTQLVYVCDGKIVHKKPSNYGDCEDETDIRKFAAAEQALIFGICIAFVFVVIVIVIAMTRWHRNMARLKALPTFADEDENDNVYKPTETEEDQTVLIDEESTKVKQ